MAWDENCVNYHSDHLEWRDDCNIIYFPHSKGD